MKGRTYHAADTVSPLLVSLIHRSLGSVRRYYLTRRNVFYTKVVSRLLFDHNRAAWTAGELAGLRLEILSFETTAAKTFAPNCTSGLLTLKVHLLDHTLEALTSFRCFSSTDLAPFEHPSVLIKQSYRTKSRRYSTKLYETAHNVSRAQKRVRAGESQVHGSVVGASLLQRRKRAKGGEGCIIGDGACVSLEQLGGGSESKSGAAPRRVFW